MLKIGETIPAFTLPIQGDVSVTIPTGKPMVLYFYPKDDTPGCTIEAKEFTEFKSQFSEIGVEIFGMSPDTTKKHDKFVDKHELAISLISDESKTILGSYGVWAEKSMYGRTYMGVERTTLLIDAKGIIVEVWQKVKVKGHVEAVLEKAKTHFG
ncbi:MAG: peroxiredoxin [Rhizobiaceae bacterium]